MSAFAVVLVAALGVCATGALVAVRLVRGPTPFDRMLAANALWLHAALVAASLAALLNAPALLDAALAIVLVDAALTIAAIKSQRRNTFQPALTPIDESATP